MIDKGKELDWFGSTQIVVLAVVAVVGFAFFLAWELTEEHPIVDLRLFARRNFLIGTLALSVAYGLFFGNVVLLPLWLQQYMGYTATWAGLATAPVGILAIIISPWVGKNVAQDRSAQARDGRLPRLRARAVDALALQHAGRLQHHPDPDRAAGRGDGVLLHPAAGDHLLRADARPHAGRGRPEQLRAHHRRRDRHVALHDACGRTAPRCTTAELAEGINSANNAATATLSQLGASGLRREPGAGDDQPHDRPAGLHARGQRPVLPVRRRSSSCCSFSSGRPSRRRTSPSTPQARTERAAAMPGRQSTRRAA